ncbi:MAG: hypothetical protein P8172_15980 [Gammaproteobacteria bacterium]
MWNTVLFAVAALWFTPALADSTEARCEIYPKGSDRMEKMVPCTFGQRQGYITITREDGVTHELTPVGDTAGNFRDQEGRPVYRQSGLGAAGLIFRFEDISIFVFWDTSTGQASNEDNPTAPFATRYAGGDYDATTLLRCKAAGDVNSTVGEVDARLDGDMWTVTRDNGEVYEVPLAAIEGG